jgi:hypothetical protein
MSNSLRSLVLGSTVAVALIAVAPASAFYTFTKLPTRGLLLHAGGTPASGDEVVAVGDVNRDGHQDVVLAGSDGNISAIEVALGHGDGTFTAVAPSGVFSSGFSAFALTLGDFDGDGNLDAAVAVDGGMLDIAWGNGDGTFQPGKILNSAAGDPIVQDVAAADVNGDGTTDLLAPDAQNPRLVVWLLHRDRTSAHPVSYPEPVAGGAITSADVNGDGHPDAIVAANASSLAANSDAANVATSLGNGDGSFGAPLVTAVGKDVRALATGDINADGHLDVVTCNFSTDTDTNEFWTLSGRGDGTFTARRRGVADHNGSRAPNPSDVALGDLDGDRKLDVALISGNGFSSWHGNGAGGTALDQVIHWDGRSGLQADQFVTGDFNEDGHPDFASSIGAVAIDVVPPRLSAAFFTAFRTRDSGPLPFVGATVAVPWAGRLTVVATAAQEHGRLRGHQSVYARDTLTYTGPAVTTIKLTSHGGFGRNYHLKRVHLTFTFRSKAGGPAQVVKATFTAKVTLRS